VRGRFTPPKKKKKRLAPLLVCSRFPPVCRSRISLQLDTHSTAVALSGYP
jgi:hypothetical protein